MDVRKLFFVIRICTLDLIGFVSNGLLIYLLMKHRNQDINRRAYDLFTITIALLDILFLVHYEGLNLLRTEVDFSYEVRYLANVPYFGISLIPQILLLCRTYCHYLGICEPFKFREVVTKKNVSTAIALTIAVASVLSTLKALHYFPQAWTARLAGVYFLCEVGVILLEFVLLMVFTGVCCTAIARIYLQRRADCSKRLKAQTVGFHKTNAGSIANIFKNSSDISVSNNNNGARGSDGLLEENLENIDVQIEGRVSGGTNGGEADGSGYIKSRANSGVEVVLFEGKETLTVNSYNRCSKKTVQGCYEETNTDDVEDDISAEVPVNELNNQSDRKEVARGSRRSCKDLIWTKRRATAENENLGMATENATHNDVTSVARNNERWKLRKYLRIIGNLILIQLPFILVRLPHYVYENYWLFNEQVHYSQISNALFQHLHLSFYCLNAVLAYVTSSHVRKLVRDWLRDRKAQIRKLFTC